MAIPLRRALRRASCNQPGRLIWKRDWQVSLPRRPYSVLLPVGFAVPSLLPRTRCALTAPFHPYRSVRLRTERRFAFCCTVPGVTPAGHYPAPCFRGARTFLSALIRNTGGAAIRPADTGNKGFSACSVKALPAGWLLWRAGAGDDHAAFDLRRYRALLLDVFHDVVGDEACLLRVNQHLGLG